MSRVAKMPIPLPSAVTATISRDSITVKGPNGSLTRSICPNVSVTEVDKVLSVAMSDQSKADTDALAGTMRAHISNMVKGVTEGFSTKLELVGVGYRAQVQGKVLNLTLGFSHPVNFAIPEGIVIETPTQTEIIVKGMDVSSVRQMAANIRRKRLPEPYKGKGIRYAGEVIILKETKKK